MFKPDVKIFTWSKEHIALSESKKNKNISRNYPYDRCSSVNRLDKDIYTKSICLKLMRYVKTIIEFHVYYRRHKGIVDVYNIYNYILDLCKQKSVKNMENILDLCSLLFNYNFLFNDCMLYEKVIYYNVSLLHKYIVSLINKYRRLFLTFRIIMLEEKSVVTI